jgi:hypothetical protein
MAMFVSAPVLLLGCGVSTPSNGSQHLRETTPLSHQHEFPHAKFVSLGYGSYKVQGLNHPERGFRLAVRQPQGQINEQIITPSRGPAVIGDSECGIGGRKDGKTEVFIFPVAEPKGRSRVVVQVDGGSCHRPYRGSQTKHIFHITVH